MWYEIIIGLEFYEINGQWKAQWGPIPNPVLLKTLNKIMQQEVHDWSGKSKLDALFAYGVSKRYGFGNRWMDMAGAMPQPEGAPTNKTFPYEMITQFNKDNQETNQHGMVDPHN